FALIDPTGDAFLHYGLMTDGRRLNLNNYEGAWYVTFEVAGSVVDEQNRIITGVMGAADPSSKFLQADLEEEEARMLRSGPIVYLDRIPLVEGTFDFDLVVENNVSREYGRSEIRVSVPPPWPSALQSSPALLLWNVYTDDEYRVYNEHYPFQVGPYTMIPALDNSFFTDEGIYIFRQIYLPENYEEKIILTYQLENDAGIVIQRTEYTDISKADGRGTLDHGTRINIADVAPGEYKLFVDVENDARGREAFDITLRDPSAEILQPFIHIAPGPPPTDPGFALDRAHQLRTLGKIDEAIPLLEEALTRVNDKELVELQIDLLMDAGKFDEVRDFLGPLLVNDPSNVTMLRVIALANANLGNHWDSIRYYERVRIVEEKESTDILNPLASAYYADGRIDKAREILQLSLKVNPEQPQIQKLLEELLRKRHSDT
ncbi:MAG: tetratricopeptide repeat protein, partial [Acidobacteriota bacterium]|nr:tetratricopeptide repeat protein [Acidobacteriota bacterium]